MQMIAHRLDTLEKRGPHGDKKEEVGQRWKLQLLMLQVNGGGGGVACYK